MLNFLHNYRFQFFELCTSLVRCAGSRYRLLKIKKKMSSKSSGYDLKAMTLQAVSVYDPERLKECDDLYKMQTTATHSIVRELA